MKTLLSIIALISAVGFVGCTITSAVLAFMREFAGSIGFGLVAVWWFISLIISSVLKND